MYLTAEFNKWLGENSINGCVDVNSLRNHLIDRKVIEDLPTSKDSNLTFLTPSSYKHKWGHTDCIKDFVVLSHYRKADTLALIGKTLKDKSKTRYYVQDAFVGVGYLLLRVRRVE